ncbi:hypothetical protein Q5P01_013736 [Channa striata]|uniref:Uncharacterized protein n=1 Tax=Channa striata TaxID=64152 RepID=A0AA88MKQ2_CHASR|nr:hypothetical protein Q5P01_013736 [Channa striata]
MCLRPSVVYKWFGNFCFSPQENQPESRDGNEDEDEIITLSDAESQSLLCPVGSSKEATSVEVVTTTTSTADCVVVLDKTEDMRIKNDGGCRPSAPQQSCAETTSSPDGSHPHSVSGSPPCTSAGISPDSPEAVCVPQSAMTHPSEPNIDSVSFWKGCTAAGCTEAIFADFMNEMNNISSRIQSHQASQEDYDLALRVIASSGKLFDLVAKQQKELLKKQRELTKAAAAMKEVVSALRPPLTLGLSPQATISDI